MLGFDNIIWWGNPVSEFQRHIGFAVCWERKLGFVANALLELQSSS